MADVTGSGNIGTSYPAIAGAALSGETTSGALGFGAPTFGASGSNYQNAGDATFTSAAASLSSTGTLAFSGTGDLTSSAASLSATGEETFSGVGDLTSNPATLAATGELVITGTASLATSPAILVGAGDEIVAGYGTFTSSAASLDSSGTLEYNGIAAVESAAASLSGSGATGDFITGVGDFTSAPASLRARGRRIRGAGHDLVDLARYDQFVSRGEAILEELGQDPQPTGATAPVLDPVPTVQPDYREFLAKTLSTITVDPVAVPALSVKGKQWVQGQVAITAEPVWLVARGTAQFVFTLRVDGAPATMSASGSVDNYYTIRHQDDALIEEFLRTHLLGAA